MAKEQTVKQEVEMASSPAGLSQEPELTVSKAKPFIKWAGGKGQLMPELFARLPKSFNSYFEPMLGGGAFFFALSQNLNRAFLTDVSEELVNCFTVVKEKTDELLEDLAKHSYDETYYYEMRAVDRGSEYESWSDVRKASRFIYLNKSCYNGLYRVNSKGQFNVPFGRYSNPKIFDEKGIRACAQALSLAVIERKNFEDAVSAATSGDFVYFDPPYDPVSQTASFTEYSKDGFDTGMQIRLRDVCRDLDSRGVQFMLSNSYTTLTLDLYQEFNVSQVDASRAINSKSKKRGKIKEVLVTNY